MPSDKWAWNRLEISRQDAYNNPIDPTYKQYVPVIVSKELEDKMVWYLTVSYCSSQFIFNNSSG